MITTFKTDTHKHTDGQGNSMTAPALVVENIHLLKRSTSFSLITFSDSLLHFTCVTEAHKVLHYFHIAPLAGHKKWGAALPDPAHYPSPLPPLHTLQSGRGEFYTIYIKKKYIYIYI